MRMIPTMMMCVRYIASPMHLQRLAYQWLSPWKLNRSTAQHRILINAYFVPPQDSDEDSDEEESDEEEEEAKPAAKRKPEAAEVSDAHGPERVSPCTARHGCFANCSDD